VKDIGFLKVVVFVNCIVPGVMLGWDALHRNLGANPQEFAIRTTGALTLTFLLLSLAVTPFRKTLGLPWMIKLRRMLGLFSFFYATIHLFTYTWFDKGFVFSGIVEDTLKRKFIFVGMFSFLLLVPLAITSTNKMVKRLGGKSWNRLHRSAYIAAFGGVIHYWLLVKADTRIPLAFGAVLVALLGYRVINYYMPNLTEHTPPKHTVRKSEI
jgi:methionine sulfoxide reductase heme-binding subunit